MTSTVFLSTAGGKDVGVIVTGYECQNNVILQQ